MNFKNGVKSVKNFFVKLGRKNLIVIGAIVLIGAAVWLNWVFFMSGDSGKDGYAYEAGAGMSTDYGTNLSTNKTPSVDTGAAEAVDEYFTTIEVSRKRARDEALEVLNAVVKNEEAEASVKAEAVAEITRIAKEMKSETDVESLIQSKGFSKCVAVINGDSANIVVACAGGKLQASQLAQINAVVYEQTGISPVNITINPKKG